MFLSLGLQLDLLSLRGRALPVVAVATVKLVLAPLVCLALARALHIDEPAASVVVLGTPPDPIPPAKGSAVPRSIADQTASFALPTVVTSCASS